jgi:organic hydroperoxide reductase OsmC/OhrA
MQDIQCEEHVAEKEHRYDVTVTWTGNTGKGTATYTSYVKDQDIVVDGKPVILGSADPAFRGDPSRYNAEDLLVASLSQCHLLWYLSTSAKRGVVVTGYVDHAVGTMAMNPDGSGQFTSVVLRPEITLAPGSDIEKADSLHHIAHEMCFIARSVNFPVTIEATYIVEETQPALETGTRHA